jgi:hypothetical protein
MTARGTHRTRVGDVVELAARLSDREWQILETVNRLKLTTGFQLECLHFADLAGKSRSVVRSRVLKRLVQACALVPMPHRVSSGARGSGRLVYALDTAGVRLLRLRGSLRDEAHRVRRPGVPGDKFTHHTLAVAEVFTALTEQVRATQLVSLDEFVAEPAAWWPDGLGGWLKPDAYLVLSSIEVTDHWWVEVDLASEAPSTLRNRFTAYLDFVHRGQLGPGGIVPRILVTVPTDERGATMWRVLGKLPEPASRLFHVALHAEAAPFLITTLDEPEETEVSGNE